MIRRVLTVAAAVGLCIGAGFVAGYMLASRPTVAEQVGRR